MGTSSRTIHLFDANGAAFEFESAAISIDFIYSGARGRWSAFETLHEPGDLEQWLEECEWSLTLQHRPTTQEFATAIDLRESMRSVFWAIASGRQPDSADISRINAAAASTPLIPRLDDVWRAQYRTASAKAATSSLARDFINLLDVHDYKRFRSCAGENCPLVFVDTSRPGNRKWCSMQRCGNRAKVRTHRTSLAEA